MSNSKKGVDWMLEKDNVRKLLEGGQTMQQIGDLYGVSKQMVYQAIAKHLPDVESRSSQFVRLHGKALEMDAVVEARFVKTGRRTGMWKDDMLRSFYDCFRRKRQNARRGKWGFNIEFADIVFNTHCPYLGIELDWTGDFRKENSPSFDRIDNSIGYVKGNVEVCSWRANRIKNDGTGEEHILIGRRLLDRGV